MGIVTLYLSVIVLLPLAAVVAKAGEHGLSARRGTSSPARRRWPRSSSRSIVSLVVTAINAVIGTVIAWVLVRDRFPGKGIVNAIIDLPFALPTIVAGPDPADALRARAARSASRSRTRASAWPWRCCS